MKKCLKYKMALLKYKKTKNNVKMMKIIKLLNFVKEYNIIYKTYCRTNWFENLHRVLGFPFYIILKKLCVLSVSIQ